MSDDTTIDVGSWFLTLLHNWWVIVGLIVIGIVVGAALTMAQPKQYTATSSVYIGQTTDSNGNPMAGLNSNAKAAVQLLSSQVVLHEAVEKSGMKISVSKLRRETSIETPSSTVKTSTSVVNFVVISVTDTDKERAAAAANALADVLVSRIAPGVDEKIALLEKQLAASNAQLTAVQARSAAAKRDLAAIARGNASASDKAVASVPYLTIVQAAATEQEALTSNIQDTERQILVAKSIEAPRVLNEAGVPDSPSGPSMTMNVAIGALAGLVIGIIVAFARRGVADRRAAKASAA